MKIKVNDMNCKHCVMSIQKALLLNQIKGTVDLSTKTVDVIEKDVEKAIKAIKVAGFTPEQ